MASNSSLENEHSSQKSSVAREEEATLAFWRKAGIFKQTEEKGDSKFVFYDGPPFANGLPHYGHILAGTIKDAIPRYQSMRGKKVSRRWGWDCHGLPVENLVEKELNLKTKRDIEEFGIGKFNEAARKSIMKDVGDWKKIVPRLGRFVDMEDDYKTMDSTYTESVWWAFKTLSDKGLVYQGFKAMQLCPRCGTTLSNFEVNQGYKDIKDSAITIAFELTNEPRTYVLAWTTTPWTLPGNAALAVKPDAPYVKIEKDGKYYVVALHLAPKLFGTDYKAVTELFGKELVGKSYKPIFKYYENSTLSNIQNAWKIYGADFVSMEEGTGIVHIAPAFGEDDLALGQKVKLPMIAHVGADGIFKKEVTDFAGLTAKPKGNPRETDGKVIEWLKTNNVLFKEEEITHSYPHCWRCDTPLLNYASSSWFVKVTSFKDKLVSENKKVRWVPKEIGEYRFGNWLSGARDWAISRSRYWGAPIPVWETHDGKERVVVGSVADLKQYVKKSGNTYFFMRHGESESNVKGILSGVPSEPHHLTDLGKEEVKKSARSIKHEKFDHIFVSPFVRTKETAEIVCDIVGYDKEKLIIDDRLKEIYCGVFDGKPVTDRDALFGSRLDEFTIAPEGGGETLTQVKKRMGEFLYEVENLYQNKKILIISHGDPLWMLLSASQGADREQSVGLRGLYPELAEVRKFDFTPLPHNAEFELDFHRPYIDDIALLYKGRLPLRRVPEVFDCWFESGSMPYAQFHYPFENKEIFDPKPGFFRSMKGYPADFIAEGLDQTRGWFYSLIVLGVALFGRSPYKNVIVNGLILAEDGQKMSKRLKNYPDPSEIVEKYSADALRYYLLASPVVRGEDLRFSERGVDEVQKKLIGRLLNVATFFDLYRQDDSVVLYENLKGGAEESQNILDQWIIARLNEVIEKVTEAMESYELDTATRPLGEFIDDLSTWYLRRSRERFKGDDLSDKEFALATIRFVILEFSKVLAPFMPFLAESLHQKLKTKDMEESVHLETWPEVIVKKGDIALLESMREAREIVTQGLEARAKALIKVRQPLQLLKVFSQKLHGQSKILELLKDELNVKNIEILSKALDAGENLLLDTTITQELKEEGALRDVVRAVQELRKTEGLVPEDTITLTLGGHIPFPLASYKNQLMKSVRATEVLVSSDENGEVIDFEGKKLFIAIARV